MDAVVECRVEREVEELERVVWMRVRAVFMERRVESSDWRAAVRAEVDLVVVLAGGEAWLGVVGGEDCGRWFLERWVASAEERLRVERSGGEEGVGGIVFVESLES